jgi:hydroxyacylglutathione hydrolase
MIIKQLLLGYLDNFTYIVGCEKTKEAIVIDPAAHAEQIAGTAEKEGLTIRYIVNTHGHYDHTGANSALKKRTGAQIVRHILDSQDDQTVDIKLEREKTLKVGELVFQIIHTPGHSPGGICLYAEGNLFTGDTLFVGDSGRTDLEGGHRPTLGASLRNLMTLPDETVVWPGHHYGPTMNSTIGWEKQHNVNAKEYGFYAGD